MQASEGRLESRQYHYWTGRSKRLLGSLRDVHGRVRDHVRQPQIGEPGTLENGKQLVEIARAPVRGCIKEARARALGTVSSPIDGMCVLQNDLKNRFCGATVWTRGCGELTGGVRETLEMSNGVTPPELD